MIRAAFLVLTASFALLTGSCREDPSPQPPIRVYSNDGNWWRRCQADGGAPFQRKEGGVAINLCRFPRP